MDDTADAVDRNVHPIRDSLNKTDHRSRWVVGGCQNLVNMNFAGVFIDQYGIGKCSSDIDTQFIWQSLH